MTAARLPAIHSRLGYYEWGSIGLAELKGEPGHKSLASRCEGFYSSGVPLFPATNSTSFLVGNMGIAPANHSTGCMDAAAAVIPIFPTENKQHAGQKVIPEEASKLDFP